MIKSFKCKNTEALFNDIQVPKFRAFDHPARRKLLCLNSAKVLADLQQPPGNHLEALQRNRKGQHSIRINDHWRICFVWADGHAYNVEITDYH